MAHLDRRQFHRRTLGGLLLPAAFAAAPLAPAAAAQQLDAAPRHRPGSRVTVLLPQEPPTLVGIANSAAGTYLVSPKVHEGLLSYGFDLQPRPQLALSWDVAPDGLRYTFRLRPGVKWHDGQPFTSRDVAFSIRTLREVHPRGRATFASVSDILTPDELTVELRLERPAPFLLTALAAAESPIVAQHVYGGAAPAEIAGHPANARPIGTGPFAFREWVRGSHIILVRNPGYWDGGKPYIDQLVVRVIADPAAAAAALESGAVDLGGSTPVPIPDLDRIKALPHLSLETRGNEYFNNKTTRIEFNLDNPYFKHVGVRQAVAHAINRQVVLKTAWYGYGIEAPGPISPVLKRFHDAGAGYPAFDPARAEALLDAAGFPRRDAGVRFRVTHDVFEPGDARVAQYIRQALGRVGIAVDVRTQEFSAYIKRVYTDRDFDFNNQGMSQMFDPTVGIQRFYWSKNYRPGVPFSNGANYANPEVDRLLEAAAVENDPARRRQLYGDFQRIIAHELPTIGLVAVDQVTVANRRIAGHTVGAEGLSGNFAELHVVG